MNQAISIIIGRKGSTGFPGKNTYPVCGRPLASYPLNAANQSSRITDRFISTDDDVLVDLASEYRHTSLVRPEHLATKEALGEDVFKYAYNQILDMNPMLSERYVVLLFCNAPFVTPELIDEAIVLLESNPDADSVVTTSCYNMWSPLRARKINSKGYLDPFVPFTTFGNPDTLNCDRDSQGDVIFANMSLSVVRPRCILDMNSGLLPQKWMGKRILPLPQQFAFDVDYSWQLPLVEAWIKEQSSN